MWQKLWTRTFGQRMLPRIRLPDTMQPGRDDRVERLAAAPSLLGEHELGRRRLRLVGAQRPLRIVQVELRVHLHQVHVRVEVGVERADVAPVLGRLLVLVVEAVREHRDLGDQRRDDVLAEVVRRVPSRRRPRARGSARRRRRCRCPSTPAPGPASPGTASACSGFSWNPITRSRSSTCTMPNRRDSSIGTSMVAIVTAAWRSLVEAQHLRVVHLVDVIAGQDDHVPRVLAHDRVEVLVDGVGGAQVPVLARRASAAAGSR